MSVTAVSPKQIVKEVFETSHFWAKLVHLLLVYYLYDSDEIVEAKEYANFELKGYEFHVFSKKDKQILENDWGQSVISSSRFKKNIPTIPSPNIQEYPMNCVIS